MNKLSGENIEAYNSIASPAFYVPNEMGIKLENYGMIKPYVYSIGVKENIEC